MEELFEIKVIPRSSVSTIVAHEGNSLKIKLQSAPDKGKANSELINLLADYFSVSKSAIEIIAGLTSRNKRVRIKR
jgi:uncharacterized protein